MTQWGLDNLFNPGKRHMDDEKRRLQSTREEIGDNSGGRRIDLEGGKVSISVPQRPQPASTDAEDTDDLDVTLEAEDVPTVALASDETEIEPLVVDEAATSPARAGAEPTAAGQPTAEPEAVDATAEPEAVAEPAEPEAVDEPESADVTAEPEPPRAGKRTLSANAWSRRG